MVVLYYLQIVHAQSGHVVRLPAGGTLERDLIETVTAAIVARGVGVFRTEAHVTRAVREGLTEVLQGLKAETRGVPK